MRRADLSRVWSETVDAQRLLRVAHPTLIGVPSRSRVEKPSRRRKLSAGDKRVSQEEKEDPLRRLHLEARSVEGADAASRRGLDEGESVAAPRLRSASEARRDLGLLDDPRVSLAAYAIAEDST
jgi:hypothetical protein